VTPTQGKARAPCTFSGHALDLRARFSYIAFSNLILAKAEKKIAEDPRSESREGSSIWGIF
jgi:hypothetical protein